MENRLRKVLFLIWFIPLALVCIVVRAFVYMFRLIKVTAKDCADNFDWIIIRGFFDVKEFCYFFNGAWDWWNKTWEKAINE